MPSCPLGFTYTATPLAAVAPLMPAMNVAVCVLLPLALILTLAIASDEQAGGGDWGVVGGFWCFAIVVLLPWSVLLQRVYRRRVARAAVASGNG